MVAEMRSNAHWETRSISTVQGALWIYVYAGTLLTHILRECNSAVGDDPVQLHNMYIKMLDIVQLTSVWMERAYRRLHPIDMQGYTRKGGWQWAMTMSIGSAAVSMPLVDHPRPLPRQFQPHTFCSSVVLAPGSWLLCWALLKAAVGLAMALLWVWRLASPCSLA